MNRSRYLLILLSFLSSLLLTASTPDQPPPRCSEVLVVVASVVEGWSGVSCPEGFLTLSALMPGQGYPLPGLASVTTMRSTHRIFYRLNARDDQSGEFRQWNILTP